MFENPKRAFGGTNPMLDLIDTIYAAAQHPGLWNDVLDRIAAVFEGGSITFSLVCGWNRIRKCADLVKH